MSNDGSDSVTRSTDLPPPARPPVSRVPSGSTAGRVAAALALLMAVGAIALVTTGSVQQTSTDNRTARPAGAGSSPLPSGGSPAASVAALPSFAGIAKTALESVVTITSTEVVRARPGQGPGEEQDPF